MSESFETTVRQVAGDFAKQYALPRHIVEEELWHKLKAHLPVAVEGTDLESSPLTHLVVLHRVLYGTINHVRALKYLHSHLRNDAELGDMGRPLKYQYKD